MAHLARKDRTMEMLGLIGLDVYFPGIWWSLPHATNAETIHGWDVDSVVGVLTLSEMPNLFITPKPNWFAAYSLWHYLILTLVCVPYLGFLLLTGGLTYPSATYPFGLADPVGVIAAFALIGCVVTWLMAADIVIAAYQIARTVWGRRISIITTSIVLRLNSLAYYHYAIANAASMVGAI